MENLEIYVNPFFFLNDMQIYYLFLIMQNNLVKNVFL